MRRGAGFAAGRVVVGQGREVARHHPAGADVALCPAPCPSTQRPPPFTSLSVPQRVDRFDDDIANIVTNSAKRSGLTFAPEAGTQVRAATATRPPAVCRARTHRCAVHAASTACCSTPVMWAAYRAPAISLPPPTTTQPPPQPQRPSPTLVPPHHCLLSLPGRSSVCSACAT